MRNVIMYGCAFLMCCGWAEAFQLSEASSNPTEVKNIKRTVDKKDQDFPIAKTTGLHRDRKATIARLIQVANDNAREIKTLTFYKSDDSLRNVVSVLGSYRAIEAIPVLIKLKAKVAREQVNSPSLREPVPVFNYFFAAKALAEIGNPAAEPLLNEIKDKNEYSTLDIQLNGLILREIYGKQIALYILNSLNSSELTEQNSKKLSIVRETIENYDPRSWGFNGQTLGFRQSSTELRKKSGY